MKKLIPTFENEFFVAEPIDFSNEVFEGAELLVTLNAQAKGISDDLNKIKIARASLEQLVTLRATIQKHGISKSMMMAIDPNNELVASGICGSYEELNDAPVHDTQAINTIEKLDASIEGFVDTIKRFVAAIGNKIKDFKLGLRKMFNTYRGVLDRIYSQLKHMTINEERFLDMNVKALDKDVFDKMLNAFIELYNIFTAERFDTLRGLIVQNKYNATPNSVVEFTKAVGDFFVPITENKNISEHLGLTVTINTNSAGIINPKVHVTKLPYREIRTAIRELHWSGSSLLPAFELFTSTDKIENDIESITDGLIDLAISIHATYDQEINVSRDTIEVENVRRANYFIDSVEKITDTIIYLVTATYRYQSSMGVSLLEVGRAALASK